MNGNQDAKKHKQLLLDMITTQEIGDYDEFDNESHRKGYAQEIRIGTINQS